MRRYGFLTRRRKERVCPTTDERKEYGAEDRYSSKPQKAHLTGKFVIVAKFGGHALHHLASRLVNVIRQGGREAD